MILGGEEYVVVSAIVGLTVGLVVGGMMGAGDGLAIGDEVGSKVGDAEGWRLFFCRKLTLRSRIASGSSSFSFASLSVTVVANDACFTFSSSGKPTVT